MIFCGGLRMTNKYINADNSVSRAAIVSDIEHGRIRVSEVKTLIRDKRVITEFTNKRFDPKPVYNMNLKEAKYYLEQKVCLLPSGCFSAEYLLHLTEIRAHIDNLNSEGWVSRFIRWFRSLFSN